MKMEEKLIICECHNPEHQIIVYYDNEDNYAYLEYHLSKLPFWERLKYGIKYIFGYQSKYGAFDEIIIGEKYADYFIELGNKLKRKPSE